MLVTLAIMTYVAHGDDRSMTLNGAMGILIALLVVWAVAETWVTYNRAVAGAQAWACVQQPQAGCGVLSPAAPPVR